MRIALLSGAVKNAGDYLITERCADILHSVYPDAVIDRYIRNNPLSQYQLNEINGSDCIIIGGGPCYKKNLYPNTIPLSENLDLIKPKIFMMGCGWYGSTTDSDEIWNYKFSKSTIALLNRVASDSHTLGCRDYYAVKVLQGNGLKNSLMTGCPAWYDLEKLTSRLPAKVEIRRIAVSDPAEITHYGAQSFAVCNYLKSRYPEAEFHYFFHRGTKSDQFTDRKNAAAIEALSGKLQDSGFSVHDIAYSAEGFSLYDSCDLHVGHRVHAHIYNLSQRKESILIEEDSRGAGVNEALGLWGIKAYKRKKKSTSAFAVKAYNKLFDYTLSDPYVLHNLSAYLDYMENTRFQIMNQAFSQMECYYQSMLQYTGNIVRILEKS